MCKESPLLAGLSESARPEKPLPPAIAASAPLADRQFVSGIAKQALIRVEKFYT